MVIVQNDLANRSAIGTTLACILTTNLRLTRARGNVLLLPGEGNTAQQSVINVSQVATVDKTYLSDAVFIGALSPERVIQIIAGIRLFL